MPPIQRDNNTDKAIQEFSKQYNNFELQNSILSSVQIHENGNFNATYVKTEHGVRMYVKGKPEIVLE